MTDSLSDPTDAHLRSVSRSHVPVCVCVCVCVSHCQLLFGALVGFTHQRCALSTHTHTHTHTCDVLNRSDQNNVLCFETEPQLSSLP